MGWQAGAVRTEIGAAEGRVHSEVTAAERRMRSEITAAEGRMRSDINTAIAASEQRTHRDIVELETQLSAAHEETRCFANTTNAFLLQLLKLAEEKKSS
jgi:hypothetical protein